MIGFYYLFINDLDTSLLKELVFDNWDKKAVLNTAGQPDYE